MREQLLFILLFFVFFISSASAQRTWNVNNVNNGVNTDFTTLQAAIDSASAGDIIQLHPSPTNYGAGTLSKKLTIIGAGYDIVGNADSTGIQTYTSSAKIAKLILTTGADHSIVIGLDVNSADGIIVLDAASNVLVQRCKVYKFMYIKNSYDIIINGNYFYSGAAGGYGTTSINDKLFINDNSTNIIVTNNIFNAFHSNGAYNNVELSANSLATFEHNIFSDNVVAANCSFRNNIFLNNYIPATNTNIIENNVFTSPSAAIPAGNITGVNRDSIFVGIPIPGVYLADGKYYLKAGSPAIGAGVNGVDAGVFSGTETYKLSGLPFIPLIYEINAPASGTSGSGLPVNIKVRANN